jgi:hypothetical protein
LELLSAGERVATASAAPNVLELLKAELGMTLEEVGSLLAAALRLFLERGASLEFFSSPQPTSETGSRFASVYLGLEGTHISVEYVWFDVSASAAGPAEAPPPMRDHIRLAVNRLLTSGRRRTPLIEAFSRWDSSLRFRSVSDTADADGDSSVDGMADDPAADR